MSKIAFCYSGEGARGSIQAGITLALYKKGIEPDLVVGTSSGGICATGLAYQGPKMLAALWQNIKGIRDIFQFNWSFLWKSGIYNEAPLEEIIFEATNCEPRHEVVILKVHLETGELRYVSNYEVTPEEFRESLLASVAIPVLIEDRDGWSDAATRESAPLKKAIEMGCDEIHVITGKPCRLREWEPSQNFFGFLHNGLRAIEITLREILIKDLAKCIQRNSQPGYRKIDLHVYEPEDHLFGLLDFNRCAEGVAYGQRNYIEQNEQQIIRCANLLSITG